MLGTLSGLLDNYLDSDTFLSCFAASIVLCAGISASEIASELNVCDGTHFAVIHVIYVSALSLGFLLMCSNVWLVDSFLLSQIYGPDLNKTCEMVVTCKAGVSY